MCRVAIVFALLAPAVFAQMDMAGHVMEMQDEIPPEKLPPPVRLSGIGNAHIQITATPEAQMWFDQGLNLLHDFWDYESARAFQQSVRVDPQCAMCYWGLYKAESFYHSTAQGHAGQALAQALALKKNAGPREGLYIEAAAAHDQAMHGTDRSLYAREQEVLRKLVADQPDDQQARVFLATAGGGLAVLESVLKDNPEDSAANHYYIHQLEGTDHPEKALHSAEILGRLAPASGHMVHMPGHIYFRVGDYARAAQAFSASLAVDERYMREQHIEADNNWNYVHNLMYAIANLLEMGQFDEATRLSSKITSARGKLETTVYINQSRDSISRLDPRLPVALRIADFAQVLKLVDASAVRPGLPNLEFLRLRLTDFASGMKNIAAKDLPEAERLSARLDAELSKMSQHAKDSGHMAAMPPPRKLVVNPDALLDPLLRTLTVMSLELRGSLRAAQGKVEEGKAVFTDAEAKERALGYREPPNYIRPVAETEGAALLALQQWPDAKSAFERALVARPNSGFALYGIAFANEQAGDRDAAMRMYTRFLTAWKDADAGLGQLAHAKAYTAARQ
jgi:tetratricopeptide (TPR) repeat protein